MRLIIDIDKSIAQRRLIPSSWYVNFLDYFTSFFFTVVFITCIIGPVIGKPIIIELKEIVWISIILIIFTVDVFVLYKMDRFTVINVLNKKFDKNFFIAIAKENDWKLIEESDGILIFNTTHWFFHERQLTIILNENSIFINVMSFGKYDLKSPIYILKDRVVLTQIIKRF